MPLSTLLNDTAALLNDQNYSFTSKNQLTRWVNESRRQVAYRTGCIRRLVTGQSAFGAGAQPGFFVPNGAQPGAVPGAFPQGVGSNPVYGVVQNACQTIPGQERYPYVGFFNPFVQQSYAGVKGVIDSLSISVNWGGVSRPTLDWRPWEDFQAYCRAYAVLNTSYPSVWTVYNDGPLGEIWMFPIPSQYGEIELDAICEPVDLVNDDTPEAIPAAFHNSIKFGAASLAFLTSQRYAQAQVLENMFAERLGVARVSVDRGKVPSFYDTRY